ncbi:hypothetical protein GCM10009836_03410 [Pseudonocardia ailaonensis]|uniref:Uncharacterized protein n=1 Tax=Pseudonocardia ailaonensis TaxID=367279 RepID=A0ABN2MKB1_9PSEU
MPGGQGGVGLEDELGGHVRALTCVEAFEAGDQQPGSGSGDHDDDRLPGVPAHRQDDGGHNGEDRHPQGAAEVGD